MCQETSLCHIEIGLLRQASCRCILSWVVVEILETELVARFNYHTYNKEHFRLFFYYTAVSINLNPYAITCIFVVV